MGSRFQPISPLEGSLVRHTVLAFVMTLSAIAMWPQVRGTANVPISLRVPGSISLSLQSVPVSVAVRDGSSQPFGVPVTVEWNLDPREVPGFRVVAYFRDPGAALVEASNGTSLKADDVEVRWGPNQPQRFQRGEATLFQTTVVSEQRRGKESQALSLSIADDAGSVLGDGEYQGVLYLEVRSY